MPVIEITELGDGVMTAHPLLADYGRGTDVLLKNGRGEHGLYIAESTLVLERALRAGHRPRSVLALGGTVEEARALVGEEIPIFSGPGELLAGLTGFALHRGLIAALHRPPLPDPAALLATARRIVVLENVVDPTNVGAIFRSVAGIGADAVLVTSGCSDPFYRRAIRVSMGTVLQVPWTRVAVPPVAAPRAADAAAPAETEWQALRGLLGASGFHVAALALTADAVSLRDFARDAPERVALVLGTEGAGLSGEAIAAADTVVQIPMRHGIDSLNVAAAAAVAMYALAL